MKKILMISGVIIAIALLTGCGGGGSSSGGGGGGGVAPAPGPAPDPAPYDVLYLDNNDGVGMAGVPYSCPSGSAVTGDDGSFLFYSGENCSFDLGGFNGSVLFDEYLYIDYSDNSGVEGVGYDCLSGTAGTTDVYGNFVYDTDDECTFYL